MSRLNKTILLLAGLAFCLAGCDVLLPSDWGTSGKPCVNDDDCAGGYECGQNNAGDYFCIPVVGPNCGDDVFCAEELDLYSAYCAGGQCKAFHENGFGDECDVAGDCNSAMNISHCVSFMNSDNNRLCTRECDTDAECDFGGDNKCMLTGVADIQRACGRPGFAWG